MKNEITVLLVLFLALEPIKGFRQAKIINTVDGLLDWLALEKWDEKEYTCRHDTKEILTGVKNRTLWATWVWDSMQLPVGVLYGTMYHLGNFDQCLKVPWPSHQALQTQYCLVDVMLAANKSVKELAEPHDDAAVFIDIESRRRNRPKTVFLGVCLPASCSPKSIAKITHRILGLSHLPFDDVMLDPEDCQVASTAEKPLGFYMFWLIIIAMTSVCVLIYLFANTQEPSHSTVSKITRCFCLRRNFDDLMGVYKDEIGMICGMRSFTCGMLIVVHFVSMSYKFYVNQIDAEDNLLNNPLSKLTLHLELCVDTFFVMSGLLHCRGLLSSKTCQPYKTLLKRYLRLLFPCYVLSIFCMSYVMPYIGTGPVWPRMVRKHFDPCAKTWWRNLLMLTNKVDDGAICLKTSWYIHCDFQLTILGTVIFMIYRKNKRIGIIFCFLAYVISVASLAVLNYWLEIPGLLSYDYGESQSSETNKVYNSVYVPFYTRASSYLIGVAMGYVVTVYKPHSYKKTISKTISILGFVLGMTLLVSTLQVGVKLHKKEFSILVTALIATFDKTLWSIGICIIIIVCEYGTLPIVNDFLSCQLFVMTSKLTYSAYLFHTMFVYRDIFSFRAPIHFNMIGLITSGLGYVLITMTTCYLIWLFIEAPVTNVINLLFDFNRRSSKQNSGFEEAVQSNDTIKTEKVL